MPTQLIVKCPEYLQAVREFADRTGQRAQFESPLSDLYRFISAEGYTSCCTKILRPCLFIGRKLLPMVNAL